MHGKVNDVNRKHERNDAKWVELFGAATAAVFIASVVVLFAGCATGRSGVVATGTIEVHTWAAGVLYVDGSPVAELAAGEQHVQEHERGTVRLQMRFADGSRETQRVEVPMFETVRVEFAALQWNPSLRASREEQSNRR